MTTSNITLDPTTLKAKINASLGRNTFYGPEGKVRLSRSGDGFMTDTAKHLTTKEALKLVDSGKVWGMNKPAEGALIAALVELETVEAKAVTPLNIRNLQNLVSDGAIFYVEFIKRTTGERRMMRCRTGVKKHLKGGVMAYNSVSKGLLSVFDMNAKGYRSIPVEAIQALTVNGQSFSFVGV